jgi:hypothetical protein
MQLYRTPNALALVLLISSALSHVARAETTYVPSYTRKSRTPIRWMNSNCVLLEPHVEGSADIDDGSDLEAVVRSAKRWREATQDCSYIEIVVQPPTSGALPRNKENGQNVIYWVKENWPHDPQAAGITTVFFIDDPSRDDDGRILDADIEINDTFRFSVDGGVDDLTDIENTVVHEMGHVLGLDHTCDDGVRRPIPLDNTGTTIPSCRPVSALSDNITEATMFNSAPVGETKKRTPEAGDILGICQTYPLEDDPGVCGPVEPIGKSRGCRLTHQRQEQQQLIVLLALLSLLLAAGGLVRRRLARSRHRVTRDRPR